MREIFTTECGAYHNRGESHAVSIRQQNDSWWTIRVIPCKDDPTVFMDKAQMVDLRDALLKEFPLKATIEESEREKFEPKLHSALFADGLMTRPEMLSRLDAGEDPLELSIEKWQRILHRAENRMGVASSLMGSETCALCEYHWKRKAVAGDCPYMQAYGDHCIVYESITEAKDAYYQDFEPDLRPAFLDAVRGMLRRLEGLRPNETTWEFEKAKTKYFSSGKVGYSCGCTIHSEFYPGKVTYDRCPLHANAEKLVDLVQRAVSLIGGLNYWLVRAYEALGAEPKLQDTVKDWLKDAGKVIDEVKGE